MGGRRRAPRGIVLSAPAALAAAVTDAFLDLLLPRHCAACGRAVERGRAEPICGRCWAALPRLANPQCERCGHPTRVRDLPAAAQPRRCRWCDLLPPYVRAVRSVCWVPEGAGGALVHACKYEDWPAVATGMARRMAALEWPRDVGDERAALVPVPLARERERERGFNQSTLLANALAPAWCVPVWDDVLRRTRSTAAQARLTPADRLRNVAGAFGVVESARPRLRGTHVVLVDDVVTTACTLNACAAALVDGGARIVSYVTFGRARS
ncbi:ComF family protein [Roseisolibacter agri]|uniref:Amidophosphoribosyltransferase n=1 Tax=Roseisolibacter agri TaxID=2014610 RepID=A0AA37V7Z9_9BACT|nr:double zinc ribbon domain-containing protein [Roseisolibacter agri]GLC27281.1 amidophosphoribosyltransferase [Roseisolibacter agri]